MASTPPLIEVIGTDASGPDGLPVQLQDLLLGADLVAVPQRLRPELSRWLDERQLTAEVIPSDQPQQLLQQLQQGLDAERHCVVLASGDPLWFGIGRLLLAQFGIERLRIHSAPSAMQLAFARIGRPWQDASWISLHGRDPEPLAARLQQRPAALAVLTDPTQGGAAAVRALLRASGLEQAYAFWLCERLGHAHERVQELACDAPLPEDLDPLHLVLLIAHEPHPLTREQQAVLPLFGLDDGLWLQHPDRPGLMTKREVRIQLLAALQLPAAGVLWDIGAGVGSIGIEALRLRPQLTLWALEQRGGGSALIQANAERFGVAAALAAGGVVEGQAPDALKQLPDPDRVLIGGGGRHRAALVVAALQRLNAGGVIVIPLATLEALAELRPLLEQAGLAVSVSQIQAWRGASLADGTRLAPLNPVVVLSGQKAAMACPSG